MRIDTLQPAEGSRKSVKRLGRGIGSGLGKTSGKGHKGQWARSGGGVRPGFEGGQMPLTRRLPKRGFTNINRVFYGTVNVRDLNKLDDGAVVTPALLVEKGLVSSDCKLVKVLGDGELTKKLTVSAHKFSKSAEEAIKNAGGSVEVI